jgi:hypothetical protein
MLIGLLSPILLAQTAHSFRCVYTLLSFFPLLTRAFRSPRVQGVPYSLPQGKEASWCSAQLVPWLEKAPINCSRGSAP